MAASVLFEFLLANCFRSVGIGGKNWRGTGQKNPRVPPGGDGTRELVVRTGTNLGI